MEAAFLRNVGIYLEVRPHSVTSQKANIDLVCAALYIYCRRRRKPADASYSRKLILSFRAVVTAI
jgi:hypothetical protein